MMKSMTVKDLFDKVSFDALVPELLPLIDNLPHRLSSFRRAYDLIKCYEPIEGFCPTLWIRQNGPDERLSVRFLDGDPWPHALAKKIVYEGEGVFTPERVAAACLWEMTFYGYSEEEILRQGDDLGLYETIEGPLHDKLDWLWKKLVRYYSFGGERVRMNRSKRKRFYRLKQRYDSVKKQMAREDLILRMKQAFPIEELRFLMDMDYGDEYFYASGAAEGDDRLPYIRMQMNYQQLDFSGFDGAFFQMNVPSNFPWPEEPWEAFQKEMREFVGLPIRFGVVRKEASQEEIGGWLLLYKR